MNENEGMTLGIVDKKGFIVDRKERTVRLNQAMGSRVREEEKRDQVDQERSHEPRGQEPKRACNQND